MIFILAQMIFGSSFTLCIKWVQNRGREDMITVGMINYIVATILMLPEFLSVRGESFDFWGAACGANMGITYFVAFFFVVYAVKTVGAASATVVSVLSIVVPILFGIFMWEEIPNVWQVIGVLMAMGSLVLISSSNLKPAQSERPVVLPTLAPNGVQFRESQTGQRPKVEHRASIGWKTPLVLFVFFLLCGNSRLSQEAFKHVSDPVHRPTFLITAFGISAIPSVFLLWYRRKKILPMELLFGSALGLTNLLQSHFVLKALESFPAFIVFPVTSAGSLMITTVLATRLLNERLAGRAYLGIGLATVALFLLYWLPG